MWLYIKYMVSIRCKMIVKSELDTLGVRHGNVELGKVEIEENLTPDQYKKLQKGLERAKLELMDEKDSMLVENIKNIIVEMIHYSDVPLKLNFSEYLAAKLNHSYNSLGNLFSQTTGTTIEQYIIAHKIERAKELLLYDELSLKEIAHELHYKSVSHLSGQFKKVTGLTPTYFKSLGQFKSRKSLEDI